MSHLFQMQKKQGEDYVKVTFIEVGPDAVQILVSDDKEAACTVTKDVAFDYILNLSKENGEHLEFLGSTNID